MSDLKDARPIIRDLVGLLTFRASYGRPSYIKRTTVHAALIVPHLTDGPDGTYSWLRTFQRSTIHEAAVLGYIVLGPELVDVPEHAGKAGAWYRDPSHLGRTIAAPQTECGRCGCIDPGCLECILANCTPGTTADRLRTLLAGGA